MTSSGETEISGRTARRLAVSAQMLAGPPPPPDVSGIKTVLRALRCLQLDPISVVAQSHLLVLWSRLGTYQREDLDRLLWDERWLFEYWAHAASIVLAEDYPLHAVYMRRYPAGRSAYGKQVADWMAANAKLRDHILRRLAESGPLPATGFEDVTEVPWESTGWTAGRNVDRMLTHLLIQGQVMVSGRRGRSRIWDLGERLRPERSEDTELGMRNVADAAAGHALRALGVGRVPDIHQHFTRDRYPELEAALTRLQEKGLVRRVRIEGVAKDENWYLPAEHLPLLERLESGEWEPRTTLLSPFDNLICDRKRTQLLWGFDFRNEMYIPRAKRRYGYYVMPLLHGDQLAGRIAPRVDRKTRTLELEGVFAEPGTDTGDEALRQGLGDAVRELAGFTGADRAVVTGPCPEEWTRLFR